MAIFPGAWYETAQIDTSLGKWWWECENRIRYLQYIQRELRRKRAERDESGYSGKIMRRDSRRRTSDPVWSMHAAAIGCVLNASMPDTDAGAGSNAQPVFKLLKNRGQGRSDAIATDVTDRWYLEKPMVTGHGGYWARKRFILGEGA
jgi:hypothetical protein